MTRKIGQIAMQGDGIGERIAEMRARIDAAREAKAELAKLSGDPARLEPSDLDASEDHTIEESEAGTVVVTTPAGSRETQIPYSEETDSFADLAEAGRAALTDRAEEIRDRADEIRERIEEARAAFEALKALTGDPDALEPTDLDASEDFEVVESEDGFVVLAGPTRSFETQVVFSEETDSFAELAELREAALVELMAGAGDPDALEPADLDASEDFFLTESQDGDVVVNYKARSWETQIAYSEETDSFVELAEALPDLPKPIGPPIAEPPSTEGGPSLAMEVLLASDSFLL